MDNKEGLCEAEVRKNLVLAELGRPLTLPLARLNRSCKFKKEWNRIQKKWHKKRVICGICGKEFPVSKERTKYCSTKCSEAYQKAYQKAYRERPEVKAYQKAYQQRPEVKAQKKACRERPEVKAYQKAYRERPEVKAQKKACRERPEVKARIREYHKEWYQRSKNNDG